jgi:hypothetical protein
VSTAGVLQILYFYSFFIRLFITFVLFDSTVAMPIAFVVVFSRYLHNCMQQNMSFELYMFLCQLSVI